MKECCWQKCWFRLSFKLRGHGRPGERINEFSDSPAINENSASCQNGKGELEAETRSAKRSPQKYRIHGERASRMVSCCLEINYQSDTFLAKKGGLDKSFNGGNKSSFTLLTTLLGIRAFWKTVLRAIWQSTNSRKFTAISSRTETLRNSLNTSFERSMSTATDQLTFASSSLPCRLHQGAS